MTTLTETRGAAFFMVSEANGHRSREEGTLTAGENLETGTILGLVTATNKFVAHDPAASDGSEVVAGVLYDAVDATDGDVQMAYIARDAEVLGAELVYAAGGVVADIDATLASTLNIIVR